VPRAKRDEAPAAERVAAQISKAQDQIREEMLRKSILDEVARMSGNDTAARMLD
jgi:hypothetical protein